ncbi:MAG TPA: hypothetical protein VK633_14225 [Verrucomicrobiae bacterium]|nr:hypothetical protein [Verrucomicrobiae bacterium]
MKWRLGVISAVVLPVSVSAVTFNIDADRLKDANGNPMPLTGQVVFIASTDPSNNSTGAGLPSGFAGPVAGSYSSGDDFVIARWDLDSGFGAGAFDRSLSVVLTGGWTTGDPLALLWFPTLTSGDLPTDGTPYGFFRDDVSDSLTSRAPWVTPSASDTVNLEFATQDANSGVFNGATYPGGAYAPSVGNANLTVVPEPSQYAAAFGLICAGIAFTSRKFRRAD